VFFCLNPRPGDEEGEKPVTGVRHTAVLL